MKIQELAIIFVIIILPISLLLSEYTQFQIKTISLQTEYDAKLTTATYDAIKAYQLNSVNETYSDIANENLRGLEASVATFRNSIMTAFNLNGYTKDELDNYIPALVYTLYDGFYIYSPYVNNNYLDENGNKIPNEPIDNDAEKVYGIKPYIKYSCRYQTPNLDVVITYALDNYITVQGLINDKYVNKSGYLIEGIQIVGDEVTYNGVRIQKEHLKENVLDKNCSYVKINGVKNYLIEDYYDGETTRDIIAYVSNGTLLIDTQKTNNIDLYRSFIENNDSAIQYYVQAKEFTDWFQSTDLVNLTYEHAKDEVIKKDGTTEIINLWSGNQTKIFSFDTGLNIENEKSEFNQHRLAVIRHKIETNLAIAISNYNEYSGAESNVFQMPELKEDEWQHITHNICLMTFLQGLPIGGKIYNGYTLVTNSESTEVVQEEYIYILGKTVDNTYNYYKVNDAGFANRTIKVFQGDYGNEFSTESAGRLNLDFRRNTITKENVGTYYYYPLKDFNASYDSIVMQNNVITYDDIYQYVNESENYDLKQAFYIALGRERASKFNNTVYIDLEGSGLQPLPPEEEPVVESYTITYYADGVEGWPIQQTVLAGQANILDIKPAREGYEFVRWDTGVKTYDPGEPISVESDIILNAIWEDKSYNVTLYANGGIFSGDIDGEVSRTYDHNEEINRGDLVDEPIRDGYEFLGWSENPGATEQQYEKDIKINCTKDMELYAVWKEVTYIITYDANGGFGLEITAEVAPGESVKLIANPYTRNGYQFLGWSTSSLAINAEYLAGKQYTPTKSTTLYAVWKKTMPDAEITPIKPDQETM